MKALLSARKKMNLGPLDPEDEKTEIDLLAWDASEGSTDGKKGLEHDTFAKRLTPELGQRILTLFNSKVIQQAYARRSEFWLLDSFPYFIENLTRFCKPDWVPSENDAVMARVKTTGIVTIEIDHEIENRQEGDPTSLRFQVVDVGGQRNERKKWIHCFDDVKAILYCDNLAGYNQVLYEDSTKNRMIESLEIFSKLTTNKLFEKTPIFLLLNKRDLFEKMVTEVDMKVTFPEYKGGKDYKAAMDYIQTNFLKQAPTNHEHIYVQVLVASWKREVRVSFEEVKKVLYDRNLEYLRTEVAKLRNQQKDIIRSRIRLLHQQEACCGQVECCGRECFQFCHSCANFPGCRCSASIWQCFSGTCVPQMFCCCCPPARPHYLREKPSNNSNNNDKSPASPSKIPHNAV